MKYFGLFFIGIFGLIFGLNAQQIVAGKINSENYDPIAYANVLIKDSSGVIVNYGRSNENGIFEIRSDILGLCYIEISSLGYTGKELVYKIKANERIFKEVTLFEKSIQLTEITVEARRPIVVKKDTIVLDAKSFLTGDEDVLEDLLKKLPGLNVSDEGKVTYRNQEIEKVLIEGDDIFNNGYMLLTKNMPVKPIDKIEILNNYSDNLILKDLKENDKTALNIKLAEDSRNNWFENLQAEIGHKDKYSAIVNAFTFGKKNKFYLLSNANNTGNESIGSLDYVMNPDESNESSFNQDEGSNQMLSISTYELDFNKNRTNFNEDFLISINSIITASKSTRIKLQSFYNKSFKKAYHFSEERYDLGQEKFSNTIDNEFNDNGFNFFGNFEINSQWNNKTSFSSISNIGYSHSHVNEFINYNLRDLNGFLNNQYSYFNQHIKTTRLITKSLVGQLNLKFKYQNIPQSFKINRPQIIEYTNIDSIKQNSTDIFNYYGFELYLAHKQKSNLIEMKIGDEFRIDNYNSSFNSIDVNKLAYTNKLKFSKNKIFATLGYEKTINKTLFGISLSLMHFSLTQKFDNTKIDYSTMFLSPSLKFNWHINKNNELKIGYSYDCDIPSIDYLLNNWILTDYRTFTKGNPNSKATNSSYTILHYRYGNWNSRFLANVMFFYKQDHTFNSIKSFITQDQIENEFVSMKNRRLLTLSSSLDYYLKFIHSNAKLLFNYSQIDFKNIVNNEMHKTVSNNYAYGFELRSMLTDFCNFHAGSKWNCSIVGTRYSLWSNFTFIDFYLKFSKKNSLQIKTERYQFDRTLKVKPYYFMDFEWRYAMIKNKFSFGILGRNLFNTHSFHSTSQTDVNQIFNKYRLLPISIVVKAEYRIN